MLGYMDEDGYIYVMSRTDDIINVGGHRLTTGGMEEVLRSHTRTTGVRGDRSGRCAQGPSAPRLRGAQGRCEQVGREVVGEVIQMVREQIGTRRGLQASDGGQTPAEDPIREDLAPYDAEDR